MTTNQEGLHATVRALTSTTRSYNEDWHALFDADGITAGPFNARMLAWINATLGTSYTNLNGAMQAFAVEQGFANWASMNTFVTSLASFLLSRYGPYGMVMDFTDASISISDETDVLDYSSQGTVSATTGALLGPGSKLTYTAPSLKFTEQADGYIAGQAHNLLLQSEAHATAPWSVAAGGTGVAPTRTNGYAAGPFGGSATRLQYSLGGGTTTSDISSVQQAITPPVPGGEYTREVWIRSTDGSSSYVMQVQDVAGTATNVAVTGTWTKYTVTGISAGGLSLSLRLRGGQTSGAGANSNTADVLVANDHLRRVPSVSTYVATTSAAVYDLPYVFSGGVRTKILPEPAATNLALRSNDFTNASWTKSNVTTALTATGPDGVANSASTLTATAGNATALQAITSGSSSRLTHCYIKRRTGTGNIDLTQDNGTTWTTVTVTSAWTRVEIASVTSTNPTVGIRIVTSGDAVDVAYFQHETGTVATSPIITYGSSVVRAVDTDTSLLNLFPSLGSAYTMYIRYKPASTAVATTGLRLDDTTANELVSIGNNASGQGLATVTDGGVSQASITSGTITSSAFHRLAVSVEANNVLFVVNGGTAVQDASVTLPTLTRMLLGNTSGQLITQIALFPGARTEAQLQAIGA